MVVEMERYFKGVLKIQERVDRNDQAYVDGQELIFYDGYFEYESYESGPFSVLEQVEDEDITGFKSEC